MNLNKKHVYHLQIHSFWPILVIHVSCRNTAKDKEYVWQLIPETNKKIIVNKVIFSNQLWFVIKYFFQPTSHRSQGVIFKKYKITVIFFRVNNKTIILKKNTTND